MIAQVLKFLDPSLQIGPTESDEVTVIAQNGTETIIWRSEKPEPTQQELEDAINDLTVVNGQVFSEWLLEHGGDPVATLKRQARERLDNMQDHLTELLIAMSKVNVQLFNQLRTKASLPPISLQQYKDAVKAELDP